jgi:hypothetical protein
VMRLPGERAWRKRSEREGFSRVDGTENRPKTLQRPAHPTRGALVENSMEPSPTRKASIIAKANSSGAYEGLLVADAFFLMRTTTNREWANDHQIRQHEIVPH